MAYVKIERYLNSNNEVSTLNAVTDHYIIRLNYKPNGLYMDIKGKDLAIAAQDQEAVVSFTEDGISNYRKGEKMRFFPSVFPDNNICLTNDGGTILTKNEGNGMTPQSSSILLLRSDLKRYFCIGQIQRRNGGFKRLELFGEMDGCRTNFAGVIPLVTINSKGEVEYDRVRSRQVEICLPKLDPALLRDKDNKR